MSASDSFAWLHHMDADPARLNVNGGPITPGQSLEASGIKLLTTQVHALAARGGRRKRQAMRDSGGLPNPTITEALQP